MGVFCYGTLRTRERTGKELAAILRKGTLSGHQEDTLSALADNDICSTRRRPVDETN